MTLAAIARYFISTARWLVAVCLGFVVAGVPAQAANAAQDPEPGAWLVQSPPVNWNQPGAPMPVAPAPDGNLDPRCTALERPSASPEDDQVLGAGWRLFNAARAGWGLWVVDGLVDYDGMCRPLQYQSFVFVDGQFAGTVSPAPMDSRTDGAGRVLGLSAPGMVTGLFQGYLPTDPLCCPSSAFMVEYDVDQSSGAPVLVPQSSTKQTN